MTRPSLRAVAAAATRFIGLCLVLAALLPCWEALRALDRRDLVSALFAACVAWIVVQAGVELLRPGSAE